MGITPHPLVMFSCSSFGTLPCELVIAKSGGTIDNEEKKDTKQGNIPQPRHVHTECLFVICVTYFEYFIDFAERVKRCGTRSSPKVHPKMIRPTRLTSRGTSKFYRPCTFYLTHIPKSDEDIKNIPVETKREVPIAVAAAPRSRPPPPDLFPRKLKTKLIRPKPALWETSKVETKNLKNTLLKKDADINVIRKTKASA